VNYKTVFGSVEPLSGRELFNAQTISAETTTRFRIRFIPGITKKMRLAFKDRIFNIEAIINAEERNAALEIMCAEGVSEG
jgi:SPP1 family predicted phage head-tail adaptor